MCLTSAAFSQGEPGLDPSFAVGALNGPTIEVRNAQWFIQGSWLLWTVSSGDFTNNFDTGFAIRADYIIPLGGESGVDAPGELGIGYTFAHFEDEAVAGTTTPTNEYDQNGINAQFIYYIQPNITFRAGYDYFLEPEEGSIDGLWSVGLMYHF
jgi:hypothetical protein